MLSRIFFYLWHFSTQCLPLSLSQYLSALLSLTSRRLFWIFLSPTGSTSRCVFYLAIESFFLPLNWHLGVFLFPLLTSVGATGSAPIRASAHLRTRESDYLPTPTFFEHLRIKDRIGFSAKGLCFSSSISWEKISTCWIGLTGLQTVPGYLVILADEDQAVPNQL